jgi:hypothetical protein
MLFANGGEMAFFLSEFDPSILNDPGFKEDAVREEIVTPLLKELGYSAAGKDRIVRSKPLVHPFVHIGTIQRKINIIPDYLLEIESKFMWVLDAKAPGEEILHGPNVEQAYSYAIHKDVRVPIYALCNGNELVAFHVSQQEPILHVSIRDFERRWNEIVKVLSPIAMSKPHLLEFRPDFGLGILKLGAKVDTEYHFVGAWVNSIAKVNDDLYTIFSAITFGDTVFAASFDFGQDLYNDFLASIPTEVADFVSEQLKSQPYFVHFDDPLIEVVIHAVSSNEIQNGNEEEFIPFNVLTFQSLYN